MSSLIILLSFSSSWVSSLSGSSEDSTEDTSSTSSLLSSALSSSSNVSWIFVAGGFLLKAETLYNYYFINK